MRIGLIIGALLGLAVATVLIVHFGWRQVMDAALAVGWQGLVTLIGIYVVCLLLCAIAWRSLILDAPPRTILVCVWARWLRESIGNLIALLPAAGEIAGARELALTGIRPGMAGASIVVDLTLELLSQIVFTLFGLALLIGWYRDLEIGPWLAAGIVLPVLAASGFVLAQRQGLFRFLERLPERLDLKWAWTVPEAEGVHAGIQAIYAHHARVLCSGAIHLAAWVAGAGEAYAGLYFMGHAIAWSDALILESMAFALRTAAFVIPARLGIQEGGYLLLGAMFGLSPEVALALSLLKRGRELVTGLPCLVIWQSIETRRLWARARRAKSG